MRKFSLIGILSCFSFLYASLLLQSPHFPSGAWTPASLPKLAFWFNGADSVHMTCTSGCTDGHVITQWNDSGPHSWHAIVNTNGPLLKTNILNGNSIVRFSAASTQDMFFNSSPSPNASGGNTFLLTNNGGAYAMYVMSMSTAGANVVSSIGSFTAPTNSVHVFYDLTQAAFGDFPFGLTATGVATGGRISTGTLSASTYYRFYGTYNGGSVTSTGSYTAFINGSSVGLTAAGAGFTAGTYSSIGSINAVAATYMSGDIGDLIGVDGTISAGDLTSLNSYETTKWGF